MVSGEGVAFELSRAGVGSRTVAAVVDLIVQVIAILILAAVDSAIMGDNVDAAAAGAVFIVELVLIFAGYPIGCEWLTRGRTVGKLWLGLRVVRDDGGPITFRHALVRGLCGLILEKPGLLAPLSTAVGLLTITFSANDKRIGDMLAGTFVIHERAGPSRSAGPQYFVVPYPLQAWAAALDLSRLDDGLALAVRQFLTRAHEMTPAAQHSLGEGLRAQLLAVIAPAAPAGAPTPWVLTAVLGERRRRSELALGAGATPYGMSAQHETSAYPSTPYPSTPYPSTPSATQPPSTPSATPPSAPPTSPTPTTGGGFAPPS
jgi:uncharacterized RDD family membrane protein YckC